MPDNNPEILPAAPDAALVKDSTDRAFAVDVLQESMNQPVIVDFWAPWCGPCKQLGPALEKHVKAAKGAVKMVKINIDENPQIAGRLRVQSIPAVFAFRGGQPVDGFLGALPESQVKEFVKRLAALAGGGDAEALAEIMAVAKQAFEAGDLEGAAGAYSEALRVDPESAPAIAGLARCFVAAGDLEQARATIEAAPEDARKHEEIKAVETAIALAEKAGPAGESARLKAAVDAAPDDHQARYDYALALFAEGQAAEAMDELLVIVKADRAWGEDKARKELVNLFEALGPADPAVLTARRKLSALLFR